MSIPEGEQDKTLPTRLRAELPGLLKWAIDGCLEWQQSGLEVPDEIRQATDAYQSETDVVGQFIEGKCILNESASVRSGRLYDVFKDTKPTDYIFCWPDGRPYYEEWLLERVLYLALDRAGIQRQKYMFGFHLFRRSCGKLLDELMHDVKMVQEYLRHSVISTTMDEYVGDVDSVRREATELIASELGLTLTVPQESTLVQ